MFASGGAGQAIRGDPESCVFRQATRIIHLVLCHVVFWRGYLAEHGLVCRAGCCTALVVKNSVSTPAGALPGIPAAMALVWIQGMGVAGALLQVINLPGLNMRWEKQCHCNRETSERKEDQ